MVGLQQGQIQGRAPPPHFLTKMRPKGPKNIWGGHRALPLSQDLDDPPPLSEGLDLPLCRLMEKTLDNEKNDFFHNSNNISHAFK